MVEHPLVFLARHGARQVAALLAHERVGRVLVHDRDRHVTNRLPHQVQHATRIIRMPRQHQVAHDDTALHEPVVVHQLSPAALNLACHLRQARHGNARVVLNMRERLRKPRIGILKVSEPHINQAAQRGHGTRPLIATRVVDDRNGQPALPCRGNRSRQQMRIMRRRHQIDVIGALVLQLKHNLDQALGRNLKTEIARRDLVVLAVNALERTAAKEDRSRAGLARDGRLLPHMERRAGDLERVVGAAHAARALIARRTATARTQMTGGRKKFGQRRRHETMLQNNDSAAQT